MLFSGKIPFHVAARLTPRFWVPHLLRFATFRHYSRLRTTGYSYYSLFVIRTIRDYSLFAIRVFQTPQLSRLPLLRPWQTRTHFCGHIVADTNVSLFARARNICCGHKFCVRDTKNVSDFVQKHFVSATNVSHFAQPKQHHGQQCVRNNVSSFTRAFSGHLVHFRKKRLM